MAKVGRCPPGGAGSALTLGVDHSGKAIAVTRRPVPLRDAERPRGAVEGCRALEAGRSTNRDEWIFELALACAPDFE
jgi:hypothetical protein